MSHTRIGKPCAMKRGAWLAGLTLCGFSALGLSQSSSGFRLQGGQVVASQSPTPPTSTSFQAAGFMGDFSGVASSANYVAISGGSPSPSPIGDNIFRNGFEPTAPP
jgi:hypothetical protein